MSWISVASAANTDSAFDSQSQVTAGTSDNVMQWTGFRCSFFDGYETLGAAGGQDQYMTYTADSTDWPNKMQWGDQNQRYITVTQPTGKQFNFYYWWNGTYPQSGNHIDLVTINFEPIERGRHIAPETFLKFLEKIGHDDGYLRIQHKMQKKLIKARAKDLKKRGKHPHEALPPWDPRKIAKLEKKRVRFREWVDELTEENRKSLEEKLVERWGITEIPPITPELLDQITESSRRFLTECLSPEELEWFDEHGHCKIGSSEYPNIYYIVKAKDSERVKRFVSGEHDSNICIHSRWQGLPAFDTLAMKVLLIKHAESEFLKAGNVTKVRS